MKNRPAEPTVGSAWMIDGVSFPQGTKFRSKYKGYVYYGKVNNGALEFKGRHNTYFRAGSRTYGLKKY